jgi:hypothetical protein
MGQRLLSRDVPRASSVLICARDQDPVRSLQAETPTARTSGVDESRERRE